ncbi:MAG: hypothetical protein LBQ73_02070 [Tannerellaceae bacterium]|nr:hypothetical protein [Tannerellaceae bacterium]
MYSSGNDSSTLSVFRICPWKQRKYPIEIFNKKSDVDIVVSFTQPIGIEFIDLADLLEKELKRKVDVVSLKGMKEKYLKEIEKEIVYV